MEMLKFIKQPRGGGTSELEISQDVRKSSYLNLVRYYVTKALRSIVKIVPSPHWGEGVRRTGEGLVGCPEVKKSGEQASFNSDFGKTRTKFIIDNSFASMPLGIFASKFNLPFCPPIFCSSEQTSVSVIADSEADPQSQNISKTNQPSPQPSPIGEGAAQFCYCEEVKRPSQSQYSCNMNEITTSNASHSPCNDIENAMQNPGVGCNGTLPRNDTLHSSLKKRAAFTLAEVLITLGIIGVVAALTMSVLISNYRKQVTETKLKQTYSILSNATSKLIAEAGIPFSSYYVITMHSNICPSTATHLQECADSLYEDVIKSNNIKVFKEYDHSYPLWYLTLISNAINDEGVIAAVYHGKWFTLPNGCSVGIYNGAFSIITDNLSQNRKVELVGGKN